MRGHGHLALLLAILLALVPGAVAGADQPAPPQQTPDAAAAPVLSLEGLVKRPQQVSLENLRRLPAERVQVSFQTERGMQESSFTGVRLWALLAEAGGIDDAAKGAEFRHIIRITGRDGFVVVISTGEIAPDFGGVPALIAYERDDKLLGSAGFRLVMPGDKHGGRNVRDVVAIRVE